MGLAAGFGQNKGIMGQFLNIQLRVPGNWVGRWYQRNENILQQQPANMRQLNLILSADQQADIPCFSSDVKAWETADWVIFSCLAAKVKL